MARTLVIRCPDLIMQVIVDALRLYGQMAFPDESSPCQMVSRQALVDAADQFQFTHQSSGEGEISSRMRVMLKAAIKNYFQLLAQQQSASTEHQYQMVVEGIKAGHIDLQLWEHAQELDRLSELK